MRHQHRLLQFVLVTAYGTKCRHWCKHDRIAAGDARCPDDDFYFAAIPLRLVLIRDVPLRGCFGPYITEPGKIIVSV